MKYGPHILLASDSGTGKTEFAAKMLDVEAELPVLIQTFDPSGRLSAYRKHADRIERKLSKWGEPVELLYREDRLIGIMERWHEAKGRGSAGMTMRGGRKVDTMSRDPEPIRYKQYQERMEDVEDFPTRYSGMILDSTTYMGLGVRSYLSRYMKVQDNKMIWGQAADELERFLLNELADVQITLLVIAHVGDLEEDDESHEEVWRFRAPGRLKKDLATAFDEIYRAYYNLRESKDGNGFDKQYRIQCQPSPKWQCRSAMEMPFSIKNEWSIVEQRALEFMK